ncbi:hypothetical protein Tco_0786320, partial [Tanacetum coccineum]
MVLDRRSLEVEYCNKVHTDGCLAASIDRNLIFQKRRLTKRGLDMGGHCKVYDPFFVSESRPASRCVNSLKNFGIETDHVRLVGVQSEGEGCSVGSLLIDATIVGSGGASGGGSQ